VTSLEFKKGTIFEALIAGASYQSLWWSNGLGFQELLYQGLWRNS